MIDKPFSSWPSYTKEESEAVSKTLLSNNVNYWTGSEAKEFETEFASWVGSKYAISLMNGTVALDLALKALDIGNGDEVIVTSRSFIASVSCVVNAGARPVFADVDIENGNLSVKTISKVLSPKTKAIICVHLAGWPCDMDQIMELANKYGIFVIEDCAQAHGGIYKGKSLGSIGHIGAWSFCQDKIMTTGGEGGMVACNDSELWRKMWSYKDHGKNYDSVYKKNHPPGFKWLHDSFGTNYRMTEIQAVLGRIQLKRMKKNTSLRNSNAMAIIEAMQKFTDDIGPLRVPVLKSRDSVHAFYRLIVYVRPENLASGWSRDRIIKEINNKGVPCYSGFCSEIYLEKAFENTDFRPKIRLQVAKKLGETSLTFLVHSTLTEKEIDYTCIVLEDIFSRSRR